ncbi:carbohydrate ABC transporter permease [Paenibacillus physcomitrellae]|uniref:Sugar ABC transporter permease n=1 Tax=Paenibacillus physcomitrellae TaxID=1619311 RepID=A0ABQ1FLN0_9BACL|nr:sugar ABC transporter permease [Paenibacillus physcomitrellae]GGA19950.1 sugar ABC transporter permease [Paenibacillus physcomitrellae]
MFKQKRSSSKSRYDHSAYVYLLPALLLLGVFTVYPVLHTFITSFKLGYRFLTGDYTGYGIKQYVDVANDPTFGKALINTLFIAFVCVPCSMLVSLALALALNSIRRLRGGFLTIFYLPQVTNVIAAGMVFAYIFDTHFGLMNSILGWFGMKPVAWISGEGILGSQHRYNEAYMRSLFVLFVYSVWDGLSLHILLFLSGLQNIDRSYYEAASLDGVSRWTVVRKITLPLLSPTTIFVFVTSVIFAFRSYASVIALFGGSYGPPGDNSKMMITLVGYIMDALGDYLTPGAVSSASAASVILMVMVMIVVYLQLKWTKGKVFYQ